MQLVCPAGSLPALKAVRQGADAVYVDFETTPTPATFGLNFNDKQLKNGGLCP